MYKLLVGKFRFLLPEEIQNFEVNSISDDSPTGYILEVDLLYPPSLHSAHSAYPLCPEHVIVQQSMLSPTVEQMYDYVGTKHTPGIKLITNLNDKYYYVTHYKCLKFYLARHAAGESSSHIVVFAERFYAPVCRILQQSATERENRLRIGSIQTFAQHFFRKVVRKSAQARQYKTRHRSEKLIRAAGKSTIKRSTIVNSDLVLVETARTKIYMNRPIAL